MKLKTMLYRITASAVVSTLLTTSVSAANNEQAMIKQSSKALLLKPKVNSIKHKVNQPKVAQSPQGHFFIKDGNRFPLCHDFVTYMNKRVDRYLSIPRYFIEDEGAFSTVERTTLNELQAKKKYVRLSIEELMRNKYFGLETDDQFTDWFEQMKFIKQSSSKQLQVDLANIDINNDGHINKVYMDSTYGLVSPYNSNMNFVSLIHINYVVDAQDHLNSHFKEGVTSNGELFRYKGRTYGYDGTVMNKSAKIYEFTPAYIHTTRANLTSADIIGLQQTNICQLTFVPTAY